MPIVYSNVLDVKINKENRKEEKIKFDFSIENIEATKIKVRDNEEDAVKFTTLFSEEYEEGPFIKVKNEVVYLIPRQISDKVILEGKKKKIPKAIVDDVVDHIVSKTFKLIVKLGLEVNIKQPLNEPKISKGDNISKDDDKSKKDSSENESKKSKKSSKSKSKKKSSKKKSKK